MSRKVVDCRDLPNTVNCTLTISGEEGEVIRAATEHAISVHGEHDTPELHQAILATMKDELVPSAAPTSSASDTLRS